MVSIIAKSATFYIIKVNIKETILGYIMERLSLFKSSTMDAKTPANFTGLICDFALSKSDFVAVSVSLIAVLIFIFWYIVTSIYIIIISSVITVLLVYLLSKITSFTISKIIFLEKKRNLLFAKINRFRVRFFGSSKPFKIIKIGQRVLLNEMRLKSIESALLCVETYFPAGIKYIPIVLGLFYVDIQSNDLKLLFWMGIPWIAQAFSLPNIIGNIKKLDLAIRTFEKEYLQSKNIQNLTDDKLVFNHNDDIWMGTLKDNIPHWSSRIKFYSQRLNLQKELGNRIINQDTISKGQKDRILILRYISLGLFLKKKLIIKYDFNTLDAANKKILYSFLEELYENKLIDFLPKKLPKTTISDMNVHKLDINDIISTDNQSKKLTSRYVPLTLLIAILFTTIFMMLGAYLDAYLSFITNISDSFMNLFSLISLIILIVLIPSISGALLEHFVRSKIIKDIWKFIKNFSLLGSRLENYLSYDFRLTIESFCYYLHDSIWYVSVLLIASILLIFEFDIMGLIIVLILFISIFLLYKKFFINIIQSKKNVSFQAGVLSARLRHISSLYKIYTNNSHIYFSAKEILSNPLKSFFNEYITNRAYKLFVSLASQLIILLVILIIIILPKIYPTSTGFLAMILIIIIKINSETIRAFSAITGAFSTYESMQKLYLSSRNYSLYTPSIKKVSNKLDLSASYDTQSKISFYKNQFNTGVTLIYGSSGIGKSIYIESIYSALHNSEKFNCLFLDNTSHKLTIDDLISKIENSKTNILILDEYFLDICINKVFNHLNNIHLYATENNKHVIVTDHRIADNLQSSTKNI